MTVLSFQLFGEKVFFANRGFIIKNKTILTSVAKIVLREGGVNCLWLIPVEQSSYRYDCYLRLDEIVSEAEMAVTPND